MWVEYQVDTASIEVIKKIAVSAFTDVHKGGWFGLYVK